MARKDSLQRLERVLVKRRDALRKALAGDLSLLRQQAGGDVVDWAIDSAQDELSSQLAEVESRELAGIESALERISEGSYGQCEVCGGNIPLARMQAVPYATLCIGCQRAEELGTSEQSHQPRWQRIGQLGDESLDEDLTLDDVQFDAC